MVEGRIRRLSIQQKTPTVQRSQMSDYAGPAGGPD